MKVNKAVAILTLCSLFFCACSQNTLDTNANGENTESIQEPKVTTENINNSETVEITEDTLASSPFKVQIDKPTLEMGKRKRNNCNYYCGHRKLGLYCFCGKWNNIRFIRYVFYLYSS